MRSLKLRGAIVMLGRAITHLGRGHKTDEWGDGRYLNPAIEKADCILTAARWAVEREFEKCSS